MATVERQAILANVAAVAFSVRSPFAVMAGFAERLQTAGSEFIPVASVRLNVIGDCRGRDTTGLEAGGAERFDRKLMVADTKPQLHRVPSRPVTLAAGIGEARRHVETYTILTPKPKTWRSTR
jgi:hypothetical protein